MPGAGTTSGATSPDSAAAGDQRQSRPSASRANAVNRSTYSSNDSSCVLARCRAATAGGPARGCRQRSRIGWSASSSRDRRAPRRAASGDPSSDPPRAERERHGDHDPREQPRRHARVVGTPARVVDTEDVVADGVRDRTRGHSPLVVQPSGATRMYPSVKPTIAATPAAMTPVSCRRRARIASVIPRSRNGRPMLMRPRKPKAIRKTTSAQYATAPVSLVRLQRNLRDHRSPQSCAAA